MGNSAGALTGQLITAGASIYNAREARKAQEDASEKAGDIQAKIAAEERAMMDEQMAKQAELDAKNAARASEALIPVGESATVSFADKQNSIAGNTADFLVPKFGSSQLGNGSTSSGLGT